MNNNINNSYQITNEGDKIAEGILEILPDGYGFIRGQNYLSSPDDVYISSVQIKRFRLNIGDKVKGIARMPDEGGNFPALIYVGEVNGEQPENAIKRKSFDDLIPIYPNERLKLETTGAEYTMRLIDLIAPVGKGQRGMIVAPTKVGKTTILKQIAYNLVIPTSYALRKNMNNMSNFDITERLIEYILQTKNNTEFLEKIHSKNIDIL